MFEYDNNRHRTSTKPKSYDSRNYEEISRASTKPRKIRLTMPPKGMTIRKNIAMRNPWIRPNASTMDSYGNIIKKIEQDYYKIAA